MSGVEYAAYGQGQAATDYHYETSTMALQPGKKLHFDEIREIDFYAAKLRGALQESYSSPQ
jgi:hypothetical protein